MSFSQTPSNLLPEAGFIRQKQLVPAIVPVSHATLWRWVKLGLFPKPVRLGENLTAWANSDVNAWILSRAA